MRVVLFHWKAAEFAERIEWLNAAGYETETSDRPLPSYMKEIGENPPDAIVIDLTRLPSQGRDVGLMVRKRKTTRLIPLVFVDGVPEKVEIVKGLLPDAVFTTWDEIGDGIQTAISQQSDEPVFHDSAFAGYAGKPLADKLGIKDGMTIALVHNPEKMVETINAPESCTFVFESGKDCGLSLWFLRNAAELDEQIKQIEAQTQFGPVWIAWQKKRKGFNPDLTQQMVREKGLANNMVDYKICSIDERWSGLLFKYRKME